MSEQSVSPKVYISYTHDSPEHAERVLDLANALRRDGIAVELDQFTSENGSRWMEYQLDSADFVLMVCTPAYMRWVMEPEPPAEMEEMELGAQQDGNLILSRLYNDISQERKYVPILFDRSDAAFIPEPLQGNTFFRLTQFEIDDPQYQALYRHLTAQPATPPPSITGRESSSFPTIEHIGRILQVVVDEEEGPSPPNDADVDEVDVEIADFDLGADLRTVSVASRSLGDEAETVIEADPAPTPNAAENQGPSPHIATDQWTRTDRIGYDAYAYAIYRFLMHPLTKPPLTISIQAPWGGGKTSLMRMVQYLLDPTAFQEVTADAGDKPNFLTIKHVQTMIETWLKEKTQEALPKVKAEAKRERLTIWFNAWKYQNSNQVWAGLADAIIEQVAARLPLRERELFWLRLNLHRVDADKIRQKIYDRVWSYWRRTVLPWLFGLGAVFAICFVLSVTGILPGLVLSLLYTGMKLSVATSVVLGCFQYFKAKVDVGKEAAAVSLQDYLKIPNYHAEIGFIHQVEADLRRVFDAVPSDYKPLVVFIDDLDRCSPSNIAQVIEAINLFLAGDFPECMFVLGMDAEMVAAALQTAHGSLIASLPSDAATPIGWRFMDKFIQLPFIIPPTHPTEIARYTAAMFNTAAPPSLQGKLLDETKARAQTLNALDKIPNVVDEITKIPEFAAVSKDEQAQVAQYLESDYVEKFITKGIESFNDADPVLREKISHACVEFSYNPREIKRFLNSFRFYYFLWWARRSRLSSPEDSPTLDQLVRWVTFLMRWPEVIRWIRRSSGSDWHAPGQPESPQTVTRLCWLENTAGAAQNVAAWQEAVLKEIGLKPENAAWLKDDDLLEFLYKESQRDVSERLSAGAGKGLW